MSHEIQQPVRSKDSLCLNCGLDVGECKDGKRGLGSATAKIVVEIWRCLMEKSCLVEKFNGENDELWVGGKSVL